MNVLAAVKNRDAVIREVLSAANLAGLWTAQGPSPEALRIRDDASRADAATRTWVLLAFDLYSGTGNLSVNQLFDTLGERELITAISFLMRFAIGREGVQAIASDSDDGESIN